MKPGVPAQVRHSQFLFWLHCCFIGNSYKIVYPFQLENLKLYKVYFLVNIYFILDIAECNYTLYSKRTHSANRPEGEKLLEYNMYMYKCTCICTPCTCICSLYAKLFLWNSFIVILNWNAHNFIKIRCLKENTHLKQYELQCMCWKFSSWFPIYMYLKWQKKIINMFYIPVLITVSHIFLGKAIYRLIDAKIHCNCHTIQTLVCYMFLSTEIFLLIFFISFTSWYVAQFMILIKLKLSVFDIVLRIGQSFRRAGGMATSSSSCRSHP